MPCLHKTLILDQLFQQAESDPRLMDELKNTHMFSYWAEKYLRWTDVVLEYYPNIFKSCEYLRGLVATSCMCREYRDHLEKELAGAVHSHQLKDIRTEIDLIQPQLTMFNRAVRLFISEIETRAAKI